MRDDVPYLLDPYKTGPNFTWKIVDILFYERRPVHKTQEGNERKVENTFANNSSVARPGNS